MFESAELGAKIDKETYIGGIAAVARHSLDAQLDLAKRRNFRSLF